jgi:hypothetical protein
MPPRKRATETPPGPQQQRVVLRIDGLVLLVDDLTLDEFREIEAETGVRWSSVNPLVSADQAHAVLSAVLRRTMTAEDAQKRVGAMTLTETLTHIRLERYERSDDRPANYVDGVPVVDPPPATGGTVTTSS